MTSKMDKRGRAATRAGPALTAPLGGESSDQASKARAEHGILVRCRQHEILNRLGTAGSVRESKFRVEISTIVNNLHVRMADAFFVTLQRRQACDVLARHSETTAMLRLLRELCDNIHVLKEWKFSDSQCEWARERLGPVCGWKRQFVPVAGALPVVVAGEQEAAVVEAPFLMAAMFLMVSEDFELLTLAQMLAKAEKGRWNRAGTVFTPLDSAQGLPTAYYKVMSSEGMGHVTVGIRGSSIASIAFERAWPVTARMCGSNFSPDLLRLENAGLAPPHHHMIAVPDTDVTFLTLAKDKWEQRLDTLATELAAILGGTYTISKCEQILSPIFTRNHKSWEEDENAQRALWPEIAKVVWRGV